MAGVGDILWRWYQASPPALLALLTVLIGVGGRMAFKELRNIYDAIGDVDDKVEDVKTRVDNQEILIDQNATELERARAARQRNDRRIEQLLQQQAASHGFNGRPGQEATTGQRGADKPSDKPSDQSEGDST